LLSPGNSRDASGRLVESQFIALLNAGLPGGDIFSPELLSIALQVRAAAERAATPADPRVHYAVENIVNEADDKRRQADDAFFLGTNRELTERLYREALGSDKTTSGYLAAISRGKLLADALALRDEIWSDLPLLAEWH